MHNALEMGCGEDVKTRMNDIVFLLHSGTFEAHVLEDLLISHCENASRHVFSSYWSLVFSSQVFLGLHSSATSALVVNWAKNAFPAQIAVLAAFARVWLAPRIGRLRSFTHLIAWQVLSSPATCMFATRKCDRNYSDLSTMTIIFSPITCYLRLAKTTIYSNLKSCGWILCIYSGKLRNPLRIHDSTALFTQPSQRHIITAAGGNVNQVSGERKSRFMKSSWRFGKWHRCLSRGWSLMSGKKGSQRVYFFFLKVFHGWKWTKRNVCKKSRRFFF